MKKRNVIKGISAFMLALMLVFVCVFATACDTVGYQGQVDKFKPYDYSKYEKAVDKANNALNGSNEMSVVMAINSMGKELNKIMGDYVLVQIEYSKDTKGKFKQYYKDYNEYYNNAYKAYIGVLYNAYRSKFSDDIFAGWSQDEISMIIDRHSLMSDSEYLKIQSNITDLEMEYNELSPEMNERDANKAQDILLRMVEQNNKLATKAGYGTYIEYAYDGYGRSYDFENATNMCGYVKEYISPLISRFGASVDNDVDRVEFPAEYSFDEIGRYTEYVEEYTKEIGKYMHDAYKFMTSNNLHYSATAMKNPNGLTGAFTTYLYNNKAPYIYQYCSGGYGDLMTYVHEFGHFTSFKTNGSYGGAELDVAEIQSQGNEMLFMPYLSKIYGEKTGAILEKTEIYSTLTSAVVMGCLLDEFQRKIYENPDAYSADGAMTELFEDLLSDYGAESVAAGRDNFKYWWAVVSHTFTSPFYYISYAVSALPSLVIYMDANTESVGRAKAIEEYNKIQQYGHGDTGGLELEQLLSFAGVQSPFNVYTIQKLAEFLEDKFL